MVVYCGSIGRLAVLTLCLFRLLHRTSANAVAGIDFGGAFTKTSVAVVGRPLDIVLDAHSKRKTFSAVSFAGPVREFGDAALARAESFPSDVFYRSHYLLGINATDIEGLPILGEKTPYNHVQDERRKTLNFHLVKHNQTITAEEVSANFLQNIAKTINTFLGLRKKLPVDAVFGVPVNYSMQQRQALAGACVMARTRPIAFVRDVAAAAVYHARDLPQNYTGSKLFIDVGAQTSQACLAKYNQTARGKGLLAEVTSCHSDSSVSGFEFDRLLLHHLHENAKKQFKLDSTSDLSPGAVQRLLSLARKVKTNLSFSQKAVASTDDLDGKPFRLEVTRKTFENLLAPTLKAIPNLINKVLDEEGLNLSELNGVEIIGGAWRVPRVMEAFEKAVNPKVLGQQVNGDEGVALGAGLVAGNATSKLSSLSLCDTSSFTYTLYLNNGTASAPPKVILKRNQRWQSSMPKTLTTTGCGDLSLRLTEKGPDYPERTLVTYKIEGVHNACETTHNDYGVPRVSLVFMMDPVGVIRMTKAVAVFEEKYMGPDPKWKPPTPAPATQSATNSTQETAANVTDSANSTVSSSTTPTLPPETTADTKPTETPLEPPMIEKKRRHSVALKIDETHTPPLAMTKDELDQAYKRLEAFEDFDQSVERKAKARNGLESYVYEAREKLTNENIISVSLETFRKEMESKLQETEYWIYANHASAATEEFEERLKELKDSLEAVFLRGREVTERQSLQKSIEEFGMTVQLQLVSSEDFDLDEKQRTNFLDKWNSFKTEFRANMTEQSKKSLTEDPLFETKSTKITFKGLTKQYEDVLRTMKPKTTPTPSPKPAEIEDQKNNETSTSTQAHKRKQFSKPSSPSDEL